MNFVELVHSLLEDPSERKYFFEVRRHSLRMLEPAYSSAKHVATVHRFKPCRYRAGNVHAKLCDLRL